MHNKKLASIFTIHQGSNMHPNLLQGVPPDRPYPFNESFIVAVNEKECHNCSKSKKIYGPSAYCISHAERYHLPIILFFKQSFYL